jgi:hypothetical protein
MGWRSPCISCYMGFIIICLWTSEFRWIVTFCLSLFLEYKRGRKLTVGAHCRLRLVMPPTLFFILETPFTQLAHVIFPKAMANGVITGAFAFCKSEPFHSCQGACLSLFAESQAHRASCFCFIFVMADDRPPNRRTIRHGTLLFAPHEGVRGVLGGYEKVSLGASLSE